MVKTFIRVSIFNVGSLINISRFNIILDVINSINIIVKYFIQIFAIIVKYYKFNSIHLRLLKKILIVQINNLNIYTIKRKQYKEI